MRIRAKIWFEEQGREPFGPGADQILCAVEREGSLQAAAKSLGMSYMKAWSKLKKIEAAFGFTVLERHAGGMHGGGSELTPRAREVLAVYKELSAEIQAVAEERFAQVMPP